MAGVPKIFQAMFESAKKEQEVGNKTISKELKTSLTESIIAKDLEALQNQYPQVAMGSYPFDGGTSLVFRSQDEDLLKKSCDKMLQIIKEIKPDSIL
jgi:molybdopterin-biosynthesis enzyme MoeA-like protein